jgi:ribosomal protein L11 methyltransferase
MNYCEVRFTLNPLLPAREVLTAELAERGFESFVEQEDGVSAYIPQDAFSENLLQGLMAADIPGQAISHTTSMIPDENWNAVWESSFDPIVVDQRCIIRAPFHHVAESYEFDIIIEPKMSFGTGHHDTTHLIISRMLQLDLRGLKVLDMGCGTGVLAVLAEKMGAAGGDAIDIDDWAYENTLENFARNACSHFRTIRGGAEVIPAGAQYDLILANINRNILTRDMQHYVEVLKPAGRISFSGFYASDFPEIDQAATAAGLAFYTRDSRNEWCMLEYHRPA